MFPRKFTWLCPMAGFHTRIFEQETVEMRRQSTQIIEEWQRNGVKIKHNKHEIRRNKKPGDADKHGEITDKRGLLGHRR